MLIRARVVTNASCEQCSERVATIDRAEQRIASLVREVAILREQLREALKLGDLQGAELERWRELVARFQPNRPERVPHNDLQLAFAQLLTSFEKVPAANGNDAALPATNNPTTTPPANDKSPKQRGRGHGRRALDKTHLPVKEVTLDPDEVLADGGVGWELIGAESSERLARERGGYHRLRIVRRTWVRKTSRGEIVTAELPESLWPGTMGDASAIANVIVSKYDDSLPLNRQEKISAREGFTVPRSTQCNWLEAAYSYTYRVVDAMMEEGLKLSHFIATDATGAPVRAPGKCHNWHVFVFILEHDHMVFRHSADHTGDAVRAMLPGFRGHLLADAHGIYEQLYREQGITEVADWAHVRRYFWKSLPSDRARSLQGIAIISELFDVEDDAKEMTPDQRVQLRRKRSAPLLDLFDRWVERERPHVDPRTPISAAFGYYTNQRVALRRSLDDGRLPIHNNHSEAALRKLVLGRANWMWFENENGLKWYCVFRSLIASCALHDLNPDLYLEGLLRLAPHWPTNRVLELSPKYWKRTLNTLDERSRRIITPPWEIAHPLAPIARRMTGAAA